jgi:hypothetical protein
MILMMMMALQVAQLMNPLLLAPLVLEPDLDDPHGEPRLLRQLLAHHPCRLRRRREDRLEQLQLLRGDIGPRTSPFPVLASLLCCSSLCDKLPILLLLPLCVLCSGLGFVNGRSVRIFRLSEVILADDLSLSRATVDHALCQNPSAAAAPKTGWMVGRRFADFYRLTAVATTFFKSIAASCTANRRGIGSEPLEIGGAVETAGGMETAILQGSAAECAGETALVQPKVSHLHKGGPQDGQVAHVTGSGLVFATAHLYSSIVR